MTPLPQRHRGQVSPLAGRDLPKISVRGEVLDAATTSPLMVN